MQPALNAAQARGFWDNVLAESHALESGAAVPPAEPPDCDLLTSQPTGAGEMQATESIEEAPSKWDAPSSTAASSRLTHGMLATMPTGWRGRSVASGSRASRRTRESVLSDTPRAAVTVMLNTHRAVPREMAVLEGGSVTFRLAASLVGTDCVEVWQSAESDGAVSAAPEPVFVTPMLHSGEEATW